MTHQTTEVKPTISVIIPTYNREKVLQEALEAYGQQSLPQERFEILVIDDGSTDGTKETVKKVCGEQPNIRYFHQEHSGPAKARNLGIANTRSGIIMFTGDDCIPDKNLLQEHLRLHKKGDAIAVLGHIDWHPDLEVTPFMRYINTDTQFSYPKIKEHPENIPFIYFYTSNISIPKRYLGLAGNFDPEFTDAVFEDVELGYRIWKTGVRIIYNKHAATYHKHAIDLEDYIKRQIRSGKAAALLYKKHPELLDFLRVPKVTGPEARYRFYQAVLDYYYYLGLQNRLKTGEEKGDLIPLDDRLKNWSDIEKDQLMQRILHLEKRCRDYSRRDKLIEELHNKNVELEKFTDRVKSSFVYKVYALAKRLLK